MHVRIEFRSKCVQVPCCALLHASGVAESDVVVLLADGQDGLQMGDREVLSWVSGEACQPASQQSHLHGAGCI